MFDDVEDYVLFSRVFLIIVFSVAIAGCILSLFGLIPEGNHFMSGINTGLSSEITQVDDSLSNTESGRDLSIIVDDVNIGEVNVYINQ